MKTKNKLIITVMALVAIVTMSLMATACNDDDEEEPKVRSSGTEVPLNFGTGCKITVKSNDKFLDAAWNTYCGQVAAMIKGGWDVATTGGKTIYETAFAAGNTKVVILGNGFSNNWETKASERGVLYVKTASISSIDFAGDDIITAMDGYDGVGKALPKKMLGNGNDSPIFANANRGNATV
jgi:hypothetical protein